MAELLPLFFAGLAFFFVGVSGISVHLRKLGGRGLRRLLVQVTDRPWLAGACGFCLGLLTQSSSVVAFTLSGMITSGLLTLQRALPVLSSANVGTAVLVFLAALDMRAAVLWLLAASGLLVAFQRAGRGMAAAGALFAIGMLFYGLEMMKEAFAPLPGNEGFRALAAFLQGWPYVPFLCGLLLRVVLQSSSAIGVMAVTFAAGGLLDEFQAMMLICGTGVGVGIAAYLLSGNLKGVARQIILFQALTNSAAGLSVAGLLLADRWAGTGWVAAVFQGVFPGLEERIALLFLVLMLVCLFFGLASQRWMPSWLERLCPPTTEQDLSRPMYIHDEALEDPETALELAFKEQLRLLHLVARYSEVARTGKGSAALASWHEASETLALEVGHFLRELIDLPKDPGLSERLLAQERLLELLRQIENNVHHFAFTVAGTRWNALRRQTVGHLVESLDLLVLTALESLEGGDALETEMLLRMTEDRGDLMERLRKEALAGEGSWEEQSALHYATALFERNVWLLRQTALWSVARNKKQAEG